MKFTPKTEEELQREGLAQPETCPFTITKAEEAQSKKGQDMIKLVVTAHHSDGFEYSVFDYVSPHFMAQRFRHLWYAIGKGAAYESGEVRAHMLEGATGYCELDIQDAKGDFPAKNVIKDYKVKPAPAPAAKAEPVKTATKAAPVGVDPEDDVPF